MNTPIHTSLVYTAALLLTLTVATVSSGRAGDRVRFERQEQALGGGGKSETFHETLELFPLMDGKSTLGHFRFHVGGRDTSPSQRDHYTLYPRAVGEIMQEFAVKHVVLSLTQGRWHASEWGMVDGIQHTGAMGAEVSAKLQDTQAWAGLTNVLSGLVCGSLNQMSAVPVQVNSTHVPSELARNTIGGVYLQAQLAREDVCTENLTPIRKLLPCGTSAGLGRLLNAREMFSGLYNSIRLDITPSSFTVEISTVMLNEHTHLIHHAKEYGQDGGNRTFKPHIRCAPASESTVRNWVDGVGQSALAQKTRLRPPAVLQHRTASSAGYFDGAIITTLSNPSNTTTVSLRYLDVIPWFARVYLSTINLFDSTTGRSYQLTSAPMATVHALSSGIDHGRPTVIDFTLEIPPSHTLILTIHFDKAFLPWTEYPPDAHSGYSLGIAHLHVQTPTHTESLYSAGVTIMLPMPDFSMPYNAITMTSTVLALLFGSLINVLMIDTGAEE